MPEPRRWTLHGPEGGMTRSGPSVEQDTEVVEASAYDALAEDAHALERAVDDNYMVIVEREAERDALAARVEALGELLREINEELGPVERRSGPYDAKVILGLRAKIGTALREMKNAE